ncbi:MAG: pyridoxamine 5'-phosphate oxidase family protein [Alphaproteobacteria bacterium]|nr:pyridoxamine 5'-phosphate oxidase family protein [Alphaproteobacteria bacterium]
MIELGENNLLVTRRILRLASYACLATLSQGNPYASLVAVATDHDGSPLLLLSTLADHTQNLEHDNRASLLFALTEGHANPQTAPRVTATGLLERSDSPHHRKRYLARQPGAALYASFADFSIWRMAVTRLHFVGGFGRAVWFEARQVLLADETANRFAEAEGSLITKLSQTHLGLCGIDADGIDLVSQEGLVKRRLFVKPLDRPDEALDAALIPE